MNCEAISCTGTPAEEQAQRQAGQSELVGQQLGFRVGKDEAEQEKREYAIFQGVQGESEIPVAGQKERGREQFDEYVARGNFGFAVAAAAAEESASSAREGCRKTRSHACIWGRRNVA